MAGNGLTDVNNFGTTPEAPATSYFFQHPVFGSHGAQWRDDSPAILLTG